MLFTGTHTIDEKVVEILVEGKQTIKSLHAALATSGPTSLRGVYKAVTTLIAAGVLVKAGRGVQLSEEWTRIVSERLANPPAPSLGAGERLSYTFTSFEHLDAFWKTTVLPLERVTEAKETFIYNPHSFWALLPGRKESEEAFFAHFGREKQGFLTIGGESAADLELKRRYQTEHMQINLGNIASIKRTDHITVIGPYIILTRLSKSAAAKIDALYDQSAAGDDAVAGLLALAARPGKLRLVIEHNEKKSNKLRKILARDFYFRKEA